MIPFEYNLRDLSVGFSDMILGSFLLKGTVSRFGACLYYVYFASACFLAHAQSSIAYEPIVSKLPNFVCK